MQKISTERVQDQIGLDGQGGPHEIVQEIEI